DTPEPDGLEKLSEKKRTYYIQEAIKKIIELDLSIEDNIFVQNDQNRITITEQIEIIFDLAALALTKSAGGGRREQWKDWQVLKHHLLAVAKWRNPPDLL